MATEVTVPTLGESITEATLSDQLVAAGATVAVGAVIARIESGSGMPAKAEAEHPAPQSTPVNPDGAGENVELRAEDAPQEAEGPYLTLSPSVRRLVLEHGLDPSKIKGTGKDGRLTKDDVLAAAETQKAAPAPAAPPSAPAKAGAQPEPRRDWAPASAGERKEERVRMTRLRQTIARRLKEAQNTAALLTTFNDVDMSAVMEARSRYKDLFEKKHGIRLGFMGFFVKAACLALRDIPSVNAYIEGDEIVYHDFVDVSVAVSAPNGLVVPVIRNAHAMSFAEIEKTIAEFGKRAKDGTLTMDEMRGGTFTISNGGVFGSLLSTPIINPPQSAVLGMHRIEERPVVKDGQIVARPMMYLALSYDHRLVDGREAVTFLVRMKEALEDPTRLLIDL
jgi:2-oxoglutarate dehydrogenase E2 component (dihydrolipoamide succinyltransferase)